MARGRPRCHCRYVRDDAVSCDLTVIGGGLAGVCAAIAAARLGLTVSLVTNRPVLGGNSSSEVRVWVCGATGHGMQRYARETGIMGELFVENQYRNPDGNPYYWDLVVLDAVRAEPNITLFLNTDVREVAASGPGQSRRIESVTGWTMGSERRTRFSSPAFADCTGDGLVGFLAGARYRVGREGRDEYGEPWAPPVADDVTLGSTILFYTKDAGRPVKYVPPSFAIDVSQTPIPESRIIRAGDNGCAYWWIEWGGELDTVHDNERIRDELWAVIYGIWDHIKNSGKFDADTMTLEWVGAVPGKREYRRFVGDYTLTQHDILGQTLFADRVAFGGWSIDLHPPGGVYAGEAGSKHWFSDGVYHIPLRSLYSSNVDNLWFAGRDISASHVAFGSTRVMATCAVTGEAAGSAAALAIAKGVTPRELARDHVAELQQTMLRQDASVLGVPAEDPGDLARRATVTASSALSAPTTETALERHPLEGDLGLVLPVDPALETLEVLVDAVADTELVIEVHDTGRPQNYVPGGRVVGVRAVVAAGDPRWVPVTVGWRPDTAQNAFVVLRANPQVGVYLSEHPAPGVLCLGYRQPPPHAPADQPLLEWRAALPGRSVSVRVEPATAAYAPEKAVGGYARPYGGPQMWVSAAADPPQWLALSWPEPVLIGQVRLIFDDDLNEDLINLHHHRTPYDVLPTLVRDFRVETRLEDRWVPVDVVTSNRRRHRVITLDPPVRTDGLRVVATATNGAPRVHVVSVRVYPPSISGPNHRTDTPGGLT